MPLSIFLLNCIVLLLINMNKNNFYVICEKIEHGFILHYIVFILVSSYSINYVRSRPTQNKTVFSLDLSGLQTPRSFQFKLSLKGFFSGQRCLYKSRKCSSLLRGYPVPVCVRSGLFSSWFANSVQGIPDCFLSNTRSPVNPLQNNSFFHF